jgi:WhiB family redox-sensing transcriptional regulator
MQHTTDNDTNTSWLDDAACAALPLEQLELFFVKAGITIDASTLALCQGCVVRSQCLEHARRHDIMNGYFGGVSPSARRADSRHQHGTSPR